MRSTWSTSSHIGVNWPHHIFVDQTFKVVGANETIGDGRRHIALPLTAGDGESIGE